MAAFQENVPTLSISRDFVRRVSEGGEPLVERNRQAGSQAETKEEI